MKYALVTGGSRGIGRACAIKLASMGYHVIINYANNYTEAQNTLNLITQADGSGTIMKFDVGNKTETEAALESWVKDHPNDYIEVLVNNAGIRKDNLTFWMTDDEWQTVLNVNLNGSFYTSRMLVKYMMSKKFGRIINIVSLSGVKGMAGQSNYSAAKSGVIGMTKAMALETAKKKVTVNAVAPGFISTDMTADFNEEELKQIIPAARFGKPEEVADLVGFLASPNASYITGEVISISGGL